MRTWTHHNFITPSCEPSVPLSVNKTVYSMSEIVSGFGVDKRNRKQRERKRLWCEDIPLSTHTPQYPKQIFDDPLYDQDPLQKLFLSCFLLCLFGFFPFFDNNIYVNCVNSYCYFPFTGGKRCSHHEILYNCKIRQMLRIFDIQNKILLWMNSV